MPPDGPTRIWGGRIQRQPWKAASILADGRLKNIDNPIRSGDRPLRSEPASSQSIRTVIAPQRLRPA